MVTGYCVKCKRQMEIKNGEKVLLKNNAPAIKGVCSKCGTVMYRFMKRSS